MLKKLNFDSAIKKVENITNKADVIMRNKLIIAIFLIVDGITFILNPNASLAGMARNIIIIVLLASFSILITNICSKPRDMKSIIISAVIVLIGIITFIYPDLISAYIQVLFALFIIYDGVMNILNTLHFNKLSGYTQAIAEKFDKIINRKNANKNFNEGIDEQKEKFINPLKNIVNKTNKSSVLYIITNIASIILGMLLLLFSNISIVVWGIIFIYTGISDLLVAMKTMDISKKIKEKKFNEILYDEDKKDME